MDVNAVLFDAGGTLVRPNPPYEHTYARACRDLGASVEPDELALHMRLTVKDYRLRARAGRAPYLPVSTEENKGMWKTILSDLQVMVPALREIDAGQLCDRLFQILSRPDAWAVYPDAAEVIPRLHAAGYSLGVVSNWDATLPGILAALGLGQYFRTVTVACAAGLQKPDPQIFHRALGEMGARPEAAVFIGDTYEDDVQGALAAGIRAALLERDGTRSSQSLGDLRDLLPHLLPRG